MNMMDRTVGDVLRDWRQRRHVSQLSLATDTGVSARHLSFLETGRSKPSREILLRLADGLDLPLRERNRLLVAGGYAPVFPERPLADPALASVRRAVDLVLTGIEPYPALALDRWWTLVTANRGAQQLLSGVSPALLEPPVNVLRLCFHPQGLTDRIANREVLLPHLLGRLGHEIEVTGDPKLVALRDELRSYPVMRDPGLRSSPKPDFVVPFDLVSDEGVLSFISTTTVFGTAVDVTVAELTIESFLPANAETADLLRQMLER